MQRLIAIRVASFKNYLYFNLAHGCDPKICDEDDYTKKADIERSNEQQTNGFSSHLTLLKADLIEHEFIYFGWLNQFQIN